MGKEPALSTLRRLLAGALAEHRKIICAVTAFLFVPAAVLLVMDQNISLPRPGERFLYVPRGWPGLWEPLMIRGSVPDVPQPAGTSEMGVGGESYSPPPLSVMGYIVKPGDTMERIAARFGLELDTLSSLNRPGGKGVHNLTVGEEITIPNQDGIYIAVKGNLQTLSEKWGLTPEQVLAVNGMKREAAGASDAAPPAGTPLFFPGAKHEGYDLSLSLGVAISSPLGGWLSSPFGRREDPFTGSPSYHTGIDIAAAEGTIVKSASDGYVSSVGANDVLGNYVIVKAPLGFQYIYGHLSGVLVAAGRRVSQGTPLGRVGRTGKTTGPHLHFTVSKNGVLQNPLKYMPGIR
jgi:murein DD-endopeptidase MepM/ murein hydrolase activator NlpD